MKVNPLSMSSGSIYVGSIVRLRVFLFWRALSRLGVATLITTPLFQNPIGIWNGLKKVIRTNNFTADNIMQAIKKIRPEDKMDARLSRPTWKIIVSA
jgi:hypothetical protein